MQSLFFTLISHFSCHIENKYLTWKYLENVCTRVLWIWGVENYILNFSLTNCSPIFITSCVCAQKSSMLILLLHDTPPCT